MAPRAVKSNIRALVRMAMHGRYDPDQPFIITSEASEMFEDEGTVQWRLVMSPRQYEDTGILEPEEARAIIDQCDMHIAYSSPAGRCFELAGDPFGEKYRGFFTTQRWIGIADLMQCKNAPSGMDDERVYAELVGDAIVFHAPQAVCDFLSHPAQFSKGALSSWNWFLEGKKIVFKSFEDEKYL